MQELRFCPSNRPKTPGIPLQTWRVWLSAKTKRQHYQWVGDSPSIIIQGCQHAILPVVFRIELIRSDALVGVGGDQMPAGLQPVTHQQAHGFRTG